MAETPPPIPAVILKGYAHFKTQLSSTLPTQLRKAHNVRRYAITQLQRGKV